MKKVNPAIYVKPSKFLELEVGDNTIRVLSEIYLYEKYGIKMAGRFITQIVKDGEPINQIFSKVEPKRKYGFIVWSHDIGEMRILESGPMLGDSIANLLKTAPDYKEKDLIINRVGLTMNDTKYKVDFAKDTQPLPKKKEALIAEYKYFLEYFEEPKTGQISLHRLTTLQAQAETSEPTGIAP